MASPVPTWWTRTGTPTLTLVLTVSSSRVLPLRVTYVTVLPKRYRRGPLVSFSTIALPGVYSVIVPLPSVVVVVVVVSETCPHANGATTAKAMLKSTFLMILPFFFSCCSDKPSVFRLNFGPGEELAAILDSHLPCTPDVSRQIFC